MSRMSRISTLAALVATLSAPLCLVSCDGSQAAAEQEDLDELKADSSAKVVLTLDRSSYSDGGAMVVTVKNKKSESIFIALDEKKRFFFSKQDAPGLCDEFVLEVAPGEVVTTNITAPNDGMGKKFKLGMQYGLGCGDPATPIGVGDCRTIDKYAYSAQFTVGDKNPLALITVTTNKENYYVTEPIKATITNNSHSTIYVDGCAAMNLERKQGAQWLPTTDKVCTVDELRPGQSLTQTLSANDESFYRVALEFGLACTTDLPIGQDGCAEAHVVYSDEILVAYVK
jgi:hypothetical protein